MYTHIHTYCVLHMCVYIYIYISLFIYFPLPTPFSRGHPFRHEVEAASELS